MKDINGEIQYKDMTYKLVFNLNVMEEIQGKYETLDNWGKLTDGTVKGEVDVPAVLFGFMQMLNEGIEIWNDENPSEQRPLLTKKQVGRILTEYGLANATSVMNETVIASTKGEEKNE